MIVICEECGKKYRIDPSKIRGAAARFKCRVCAHTIVVSKPPSASPTALPADLPGTEAAAEATDKEVPAAEPEIKLDRPGPEHVQVKSARKSGPFNLRIKMLVLFFFILSSAFGNTVCWRGIPYKLLGPNETIVLDNKA